MTLSIIFLLVFQMGTAVCFALLEPYWLFSLDSEYEELPHWLVMLPKFYNMEFFLSFVSTLGILYVLHAFGPYAIMMESLNKDDERMFRSGDL